MAKTSIVVFTGHHSDGKNQVKVGASYGQVVQINGLSKKLGGLYGEEDTYMTVWLKGISVMLKQVLSFADTMSVSESNVEIDLTVHMYHKNVIETALKLGSVFRSVRDVSEGRLLDYMIDKKLSKANGTPRPHHDLLVDVMKLLISLHRTVTFQLKFKPITPKGSPDMGMAYQQAQIEMDMAIEKKASLPDNVVSIDRK